MPSGETLFPALSTDSSMQKTVGNLNKIEATKTNATNSIRAGELITKHLKRRTSFDSKQSQQTNHFIALETLLGKKSKNTNLSVGHNKISFGDLTIEAVETENSQIAQLVFYSGKSGESGMRITEFNNVIETLCKGSSEFQIIEESGEKWVKSEGNKVLKLPANDLFDKEAVFEIETRGAGGAESVNLRLHENKFSKDAVHEVETSGASGTKNVDLRLHENEFYRDLKIFIEQMEKFFQGVIKKNVDTTAKLWDSFSNCIKNIPAVCASQQIKSEKSAIKEFEERLEYGAKEMVKHELNELAKKEVYQKLNFPSLVTDPSRSSNPSSIIQKASNIPDLVSLSSTITTRSMNLPLLGAAVNVGFALTFPSRSHDLESKKVPGQSQFSIIGESVTKLLKNLAKLPKPVAEVDPSSTSCTAAEPNLNAEQLRKEQLAMEKKKELFTALDSSMNSCIEITSACEQVTNEKCGTRFAEKVCAEVASMVAQDIFSMLIEKFDCNFLENNKTTHCPGQSVETDGTGRQMSDILQKIKDEYAILEKKSLEMIEALKKENQELRAENENCTKFSRAIAEIAKIPTDLPNEFAPKPDTDAEDRKKALAKLEGYKHLFK
jgi:hypothetical protein